MITRIHMQDQVHNRIEEFTKEEGRDWDEIFQNVATLSLIILFFTLGVSW